MTPSSSGKKPLILSSLSTISMTIGRSSESLEDLSMQAARMAKAHRPTQNSGTR